MIRVIIVGRYSVGKSTLFNRITKGRNIVLEDEGTTIDTIKETVNFKGVNLVITDTAGFSETRDTIGEFQKRKMFEELKIADKIIFVADGTTELLGRDLEIVEFLRENNFIDKTIVAVNKADKKEFCLNDFYELGIEKIYPISAKEGIGVYELLDEIIEGENQTEEVETVSPKDYPAIAIVGKPNVGKSTLFNRILNEERAIVSEKEFTTRDALKEKIEFNGNEYLFIDTAGLRSKKMHEFGPIYLSMKRTENAIVHSDVVIIMTDGSSEITREDQKISRLVLEKRKACIIIVNKSDLIKDKDKILTIAKEKLRFLYFAPVLFISAEKGLKVNKIFGLIDEVFNSYKAQFKTSLVNKVIQGIVANAPNTDGKIFYATQTSTMPPKFLLFVNDKKRFDDAFLNFLKRKIIEELSLVGTPIEIELRGRRENSGRS